MKKSILIAAVMTCGALALAAPAAYAKGGGGHGGGGHGGGHGHSGGHHGGHSGHHGGHYAHHGGHTGHYHGGYRPYSGYGRYGYGGYGGYGYNNYWSWYPWYLNYGYGNYGNYGYGYGNYGNYYYPNYYNVSTQNFMNCPNGVCPAGMQNDLPQNALPEMTTVSQEQPAPAGTPAPMGPNQLKIRNPRSSRGALTYVLNGNPFKIEPGQAQVLDATRKWVIAFNRGPGMGNAVYSLTPGMTYNFTVSLKGWELMSQP